MIILRRTFNKLGIQVTPDTTDQQEEVCCDLTVGDSYMEAGQSETYEMTQPYRLNPGRCIVVQTAEKLTLPNNTFGFLCSKGSLAARGLLVPNTKIDPLFSGKLDVAIYNSGQRFLEIKQGMKFCAVVFQELKEPIKSHTVRSGPRISTERKNKVWDFIQEHAVLIITSIVTILLSIIGAVVGTYMTLGANK